MHRAQIPVLIALALAWPLVEGCGEPMEAECESSEDCRPGEGATGEVCIGNTCVPCGSDQDCTGDPVYGDRAVCLSGVCQPCPPGRVGCPCLASGACLEGPGCDGEVCRECVAGQPLCPCEEGGVCAPNVECLGDRCVDGDCTPGTEDCPCDEGECDQDLVCGDGICRRCPAGEEGCPCGQGGLCDGAQVCHGDNRCHVCVEFGCEEHRLCQWAEQVQCLDECELGYVWNSAGGRCESAALNCTPGSPGSLVETCAAQNRQCEFVGSGATCGDCVEGFVEERGSCRAVITCADLGCAAENRVCIPGGTTDSICGGCSANAVDVDGVCELTTCSDVPGDPHSVLDTCTSENRRCEEDAVSGASCGECLPNFVYDPDTDTCNPPPTCEELGCEAQFRPCYEDISDDPEGDPEAIYPRCGACIPGTTEVTLDDGETKACVGAASCSNSDECLIEGTYCVQLSPVALPRCEAPRCPVPAPGEPGSAFYALNPGRAGPSCVTCPPCPAAGECDGLTPCPGNGVCRSGSCVPNNGEDCSDTNPCPAGGVCIQGTCSYGTTGLPWPATTFNGVCVCETLDGYFFDTSLRERRAIPCDADGDGWVRDTARAFVEEPEDLAISENARCDVRRIDRFALVNELEQEREILVQDLDLQPELPVGTIRLELYETLRNDSQADLESAGDFTFGSRAPRAAELNPLTRLCANADYNDDGLTDYREGDGSELRGSADDPAGDRRWMEGFKQFSYFMELHTGWYEPPGEGDRYGRYVIAERSRCDPDFALGYDHRGGDGFEPEDTTYWQTCYRRRAASFEDETDPDALHRGYDFARWGCEPFDSDPSIPEEDAAGMCSALALVPTPPPADCSQFGECLWGVDPHGICDVSLPPADGIWRGMNHHSQFRCVKPVRVTRSNPLNPLERPWEVDIEDVWRTPEDDGDQYHLNLCRLQCPSAERDLPRHRECDEDADCAEPWGLGCLDSGICRECVGSGDCPLTAVACVDSLCVECLMDEMCPGEAVCRDGFCDECGVDEDCADGEVCGAGFCCPLTTQPIPVVGNPDDALDIANPYDPVFACDSQDEHFDEKLDIEGSVTWVATRFEHYERSFEYGRGCIDEGTEWPELCPGYTEDPLAVAASVAYDEETRLPKDFGHLQCSCSWYRDQDCDGYGDPLINGGCGEPGYVPNNFDSVESVRGLSGDHVVSCDPDDAQAVGDDFNFLGFYWDGETCIGLHGTRCEGEDCCTWGVDCLYEDQRDCVAGHQSCDFCRAQSVSVAEVGELYGVPDTERMCEPADVVDFGIFWTGESCEFLSGCACEGVDCGDPYQGVDCSGTEDCLRECAVAHMQCYGHCGVGLLPQDAVAVAVGETYGDPPQTCVQQDVGGLGIFWNGQTCERREGCACVGEDCDDPYQGVGCATTEECVAECEDAHLNCNGRCALNEDMAPDQCVLTPFEQDDALVSHDCPVEVWYEDFDCDCHGDPRGAVATKFPGASISVTQCPDPVHFCGETIFLGWVGEREADANPTDNITYEDCDPLDEEAYPGQTACFSDPRITPCADGNPCRDYNCDGVEENCGGGLYR